MQDFKFSKKIITDFGGLEISLPVLEFGKRLQVAQMLNKNVPYAQIIGKTGLNSATIARISKWLYSGMGGYRLVLSKLAHRHNSSSRHFGGQAFEKGLR